jgi:lia operon protein LiaG
MDYKTQLLVFALVLFGFQGFTQSEISKIDVNYSDVKELKVRGSFCDVTIEGTSGKSASVKGMITGNGAQMEIKHSFSNGVLEIWVEKDDKRWKWNNNLRGTISISIPKDTEVNANNSSGDLEVKNLDGRTISLRASSGDVDAENLVGDLSITASSGDLTLNNLKGDLSGRTSSGSQVFRNVTGDIRTVSSSGDIDIEKSNGKIDAVASSGRISLRDTEGFATIKTSSGDIDGKNVMLTESSDFKTTSGDIDIDLKNDIQSLSFYLKASSGSLRAGDNKADRKLILSNGNIKVDGLSSSGSQRYY